MPEQIETAKEWVLNTCVNDGHVTAGAVEDRDRQVRRQALVEVRDKCKTTWDVSNLIAKLDAEARPVAEEVDGAG